ncbi:MAG: hypothetical protein GYA83_10670 [Deltaproteobacteria bacterium]|nr:hypothetical protein [Deltaproteobacteria bacterium]
MKPCMFSIGVLAWLLFMSTTGTAQIYNQTCQSAEYARMVNRNAANDAADIIVYNPAGLVDLPDGFHLNVSNQIWFNRPSHTFDDPLGDGRLTFEQEGTDWFVPNLHAVYGQDDWSVFGSIYIPGGGASVDYPDGSYTTRALGDGIIHEEGSPAILYRDIKDDYLEGSSLYLAVGIGGAYRLNGNVSLAVGVRTITVNNEIEGGLTLTDGLFGPLTEDVPLRVDVKETGQGWGLVLGIQVKPAEDLNLALHYETPVRLDLETDIRSGDTVSEESGLFIDGQENPRALPAMVGLGASYRFSPRLRCEVDFNYWFQEDADWGRAADGRNNASLAGDSWSAGLAGAYQLAPGLELSGGFLYTWYEFPDFDGYYTSNLGAIEVYYADDVMFGVGFGYEVAPGCRVNLGTGYIIYKDGTVRTGTGDVKIENSASTALALGLDYSF